MKISFVVLVICSTFFNIGIAQSIDLKTIYNCKVTYDVRVIDSSATSKQINDVAKSVKISYVKGNKSRNDFISPGFLQTTIFRGSTDTVVILKHIGNEKYVTYVNDRLAKQENDKYNGIRFITTRASKNILGYECKRVQAQLPDGTYFYVYYAPVIEPSNKQFEQQFKELPGFVLEYEAFSRDGKTRVRYTATSIDLSEVPDSKFDWPSKGYKVL